MSTTLYVGIGLSLKTDGTQSVFNVNLVKSPLYIVPFGPPGGAGMPTQAFDLLRPKPSGVSGFNAGISGVLNGYEITLTFDSPPPAPILNFQFRLEYTS